MERLWVVVLAVVCVSLWFQVAVPKESTGSGLSLLLSALTHVLHLLDEKKMPLVFLKEYLKEKGIPCKGCKEYDDYLRKAMEAMAQTREDIKQGRRIEIPEDLDL